MSTFPPLTFSTFTSLDVKAFTCCTNTVTDGGALQLFTLKISQNDINEVYQYIYFTFISLCVFLLPC